ncbi:immunity 42 family protein [Leclercia adecarboxylata]|uniref:immunity 42 family protein n=1 Tax=Leclercia adecarboxylata TaxID=83655 RepID=UPI0013C6FE9D|nr:immunity 42 family protein [Leclercia adecarboxylata]NEG93317.1 hypothetical protein [Leclercia adecarboxylata]
MIFGKPFEFAVFYEVLEKTEDEFWKYGVFVFFIDDEIYPSRGSNYTLHMAMSYLKDCHYDIAMCKDIDFSIYGNELESFVAIAHSHGVVLDSDPDDLVFLECESIGVFLSPGEISDAGFYLFYLSIDQKTECLLFSSDYGKTAKKIFLQKGTVQTVIEQLPGKERI